jgi:hypothetical protein
LINNIAQWLQIDAFTLLKTVLAVAVMTSPARKPPIVYHLDQGVPSIEQVTFNPPFTNHLYFVYLKKTK